MWTVVPVAANPGRVPVIVTGWDSPNTRQFLEGLTAFEDWGVFDGTTLRAERVLENGEAVSAINAFNGEEWAWEEFADALADLQAAEPRTCVENYLMVYSNPGDVDWFDDAGWRAITEHWRLLARLAQKGRLRGLLFDAEPYTPPHSQYTYAAQPERDLHTFAEYQEKARQRGREVMTAVAKEYPDITIFAYRLFSDLLGLLDCGDLSRALEVDTYGLLPAFVDGWLDVMPPGARIIEGTEDIGYRANSRAAYDGAYTRLRLRIPDFLAPEHREEASAHFRIGHSLYLDAYINPPDSPWYIDRAGTTAAARLSANLSSALEASDGLVWLYGEKARWWEAGNPEYPFWPDVLTGAVEAIRRARDPAAYARTVWSSSPPPQNLLPNPGFGAPEAAPGAPEGWFEWQRETSHGQVAVAGGEVRFRGVLDGVVGTEIPVVPRHLYAVRTLVRQGGRGLGLLTIGWKDEEGRWTAYASNKRFVGDASEGPEGWREIAGLVEVPPEASRMVFMVTSLGQFRGEDWCAFREPGVAEVEP